MKHANPLILTVNGGSSSIKFALFEAGGALKRVLGGALERIGFPGATLTIKGLSQSSHIARSVTAPDHLAAARLLMDEIDEFCGQDALAAIGHRVVHGGQKYYKPEHIKLELIQDLKKLISLDPDHLPVEIALIEAFCQRFPEMFQLACFDTAFHHDLPRMAAVLPIPRRYESQGIRRYGFHGLSYAYLMEELAILSDSGANKGCVILAHLGNGVSLAAVQQGKVIDTSMSFTPASGVPMGTRSGDLDPGLAGYLARTEGLDAKGFNKMINHQSGLLGVSETSSDMRDLLELEAHDQRSAEAIALFCYEVKKRIGAYAAAMGGLDTLVFAGGIGENAPVIRSRICHNLGVIGIQIDEKKNIANEGKISAGASKVVVRVIRTDEELMIARSVDRSINQHS